MARTTTAALAAANAKLEARVNQLELKLAAVPKTPPKGACHVFVGTRKAPYLTALSHSTAYAFMKAAKEAGLHSHYRPVQH